LRFFALLMSHRLKHLTEHLHKFCFTIPTSANAGLKMYLRWRQRIYQ
jgi:hypothetical protein